MKKLFAAVVVATSCIITSCQNGGVGTTTTPQDNGERKTILLSAIKTQGVSSIGEPNETIGVTESQAEERNLTFGATPTLPLRQTQNWGGFETKAILLDFDTASLRGMSVEQAWLHLAAERGDLYGVGVCTVLAPWQESSVSGVEQPGAPSWLYRTAPQAGVAPMAENFWAWPGSRFYSVAWMHPALSYSHADPDQLIKYTDAAGTRWIKIPVDPRLVAAIACGASCGWVITDDKGAVAESAMLDGLGVKDFKYSPAYDIQIFTRHAGAAKTPKLEVIASKSDRIAPSAVADMKVESTDPADGTVAISWLAPGDDGQTGDALAYRISDHPAASLKQSYPLYYTPLPSAAGQRQTMQLLGLSPGMHTIEIHAIDDAGNAGPAAAINIDVPAPWQSPAQTLASNSEGKLVWADVFGNLQLLVTDDLLRIEPVGGQVLLEKGATVPTDEYRRNFDDKLWSPDARKISLCAAANETVAFQIYLKRGNEPAKNIRIQAGDLKSESSAKIDAARNIELFRQWYVKCQAGPEKKTVWAADPLIPLDGRFGKSLNIPNADNAIADQKVQGVFCDIYVPRGTPPGKYTGLLEISMGEMSKAVQLHLELEVLPLTIPDEISWPVELNTYTGVGSFVGLELHKQPAEFLSAERQIYQLAQKHRTTLNIVPYTQSGRIGEAAAPELAGDGADRKVADWSKFDSRYSQYLDGSAFSAAAGYYGPCANQSVTHMYLPFHENWPMPMKDYYAIGAETKDRRQFGDWAKTSLTPARSFKDGFAQGYSAVAGQFADHIAAKGWTRTSFQFFMNNKYYFKCNFFGTMGQNGTSYWLLDESIDYDDFAANALFLGLGRRGVESSSATDKVKMQYRVDASAPWLARGMWDGVVNLDCSSWLARVYPSAIVRQKWNADEKWQSYGGGVDPDGPTATIVRNYLARYCWGAVGELTYWNNLGRAGDWTRGEHTAILYPARTAPGRTDISRDALPSMRLKAMRRGQQDIEYLNLLAAKIGKGKAVKILLKLAGEEKTFQGQIFQKLDESSLAEIRRIIADEIRRK